MLKIGFVISVSQGSCLIQIRGPEKNAVLLQWNVGSCQLPDLSLYEETRVTSSLLKHLPVRDWKPLAGKLTSSLLQGVCWAPFPTAWLCALNAKSPRARGAPVQRPAGDHQAFSPESRRSWTLPWSSLLLRGDPCSPELPCPGDPPAHGCRAGVLLQVGWMLRRTRGALGYFIGSWRPCPLCGLGGMGKLLCDAPWNYSQGNLEVYLFSTYISQSTKILEPSLQVLSLLFTVEATIWRHYWDILLRK